MNPSTSPWASWPAYTELARRLDEVRRAEEEHSENVQRRVEAAQNRISELDSYLSTQRGHLTDLARQVRQPRPAFAEPPPEFTGALEETIRTAERYADEAADAAEEVARLATEPVLLPRWSVRSRNAVIYLMAAGGALVGQAVLLALQALDQISWWTAAAWALFGLPTLAFFVGYVLVGVLGVPRTGASEVERSPRLGFAICMASLPVWGVLTELIRHMF